MSESDFTTAKVMWRTRIPALEDVEGTLNEMSNKGWNVHQISQPILTAKKEFAFIIFNRAKIVKGEEARQLVKERGQ